MSTTVKVIRILDRDQAISGIARVRQEWEELAGSESLIKVNGSIGFILADIVKALGLNGEDEILTLGSNLAQEIMTIQTIPSLPTIHLAK